MVAAVSKLLKSMVTRLMIMRANDTRMCPTCEGTGRIGLPPLIAADGDPRCDYVSGTGARCELTPHERVYPHRVTSPPVVITDED